MGSGEVAAVVASRSASDASSDAVYAALFASSSVTRVRLAPLIGADDPEDVAQEAFARLHVKASGLRDPNAAAAYVRTTVVNLSHSRLRRARVARRHPGSVGEAVSAEIAALAREDIRAVATALLALPRRQREVLVLRYWLDLPEAQIARELSISPGSVKTHASRGIISLGRVLDPERQAPHE